MLENKDFYKLYQHLFTANQGLNCLFFKLKIDVYK